MQKAIVITGANSNIGSFIAQKLAQKNEKLILVYHKQTNKIVNLLTSFLSFSCDLNINGLFEEKLQKILLENKLELKGLIHTPSVRASDAKSLKNANASFWQNVVNQNINPCFNVLKGVLNYISKNGNIVLFSSDVTKTGLKNGSSYAASKAAISSIVKSVALEEAENNILINAVSPGPVIIDNSGFEEEYINFRQNYYNQQKQKTPLNRLANLNDIYPIVEFLMYNNTFITGQEFYVNGGK